MPLSSVTTPGGTIGVLWEAGPDYPGVAVTINGEVAAVVEWNPEHHALVVRTYDPVSDLNWRAYYRWDTGADIPSGP